MSHEILNPESLGPPRGFNHGLLAPAGGRVLFVAGQPALDREGRVPTADFVEQFGLALDRVLAVVRAAGGETTDIGRLTIYVTDLAAYRASLEALGRAYRARMGRHYPAIALVEVRGLVDEGARVEIEATAVIPGGTDPRGGSAAPGERPGGPRIHPNPGTTTNEPERGDDA